MDKIIAKKQHSVFLGLLFYSLLSFFSSSCFAADARDTSNTFDTPSESIKTFYQYIAERQCQEAVKLRPNYSIQRCKKITKVHIHKVTTEISDNNNAVLLLELDSFYEDKKSYFFGYVRLTKKKGQWLIVGPFKSSNDYGLDEYVETYIPEKFKALSKAVKVNQKKIAPPGDSIDADEFAQQKAKRNIDKSILTHTAMSQGISVKDTISDRTSNITSNATLNTTASNLPPITVEAEKFLLGHDAIEGNYASLLKKIRKHFPTKAIATVLLIDKSRRTLYAYNAQNLLLGALPILSSDNSSFPSGLYSLSSTKAVASSDGIAQQTHHPITLKRMLITDTKDNPLYYIRDFLDTDKNNSLQLSPIDSKKLQQFISSSAIAYIGQ